MNAAAGIAKHEKSNHELKLLRTLGRDDLPSPASSLASLLSLVSLAAEVGAAAFFPAEAGAFLFAAALEVEAFLETGSSSSSAAVSFLVA